MIKKSRFKRKLFYPEIAPDTCNKKCHLLIIGGFCFYGVKRFDDRAGVRMLQDTLQSFLISIGFAKHSFDNKNLATIRLLDYGFAEGRAWLKLRVSILVDEFFGLQYFWSHKANHSKCISTFSIFAMKIDPRCIYSLFVAST